MKSKSTVILISSLMALGLGACGSQLANTKGKKQEFKAQSEDKAVDFSLLNLRGEKVSLQSFQGKVVILQFFSVACRSCKVETREFEKHLIAKNKSSDFEIIGISVKSSPAELEQWIEDTGATYEMLLDTDGSVFAKLKKTETFPTLIYLDRNHRIRLKQDFYSGLSLVEKNLQALLDERYEDVAPAKESAPATTPPVSKDIFDMFVPDICDGPCARGVEQALASRDNIATATIDSTLYRLRVSFRAGMARDEEALLSFITDMGYTPSRFTNKSLASIDKLDLVLQSFPADQSPESLALDISMEEIPLYQVHFDVGAKKVHITFEKGAYTREEIKKVFAKYQVEVAL